MAWIRLSDTYIDHPKFLALSDGAFRLWHEGMAYCRKHQTDGIIPFQVMRGFRYFTKSREKQLSTAVAPGHPLWVLIPATGYKVHDYLDWNLSKDEEQLDRDAAAARMRRLRAGKPPVMVGACSPERSPEQQGERSPVVPYREGSGSLVLSEREKGDATIVTRAARLREELFPAWYHQHRGGRIPLVASPKELAAAAELCRHWSDQRLQEISEVILTTDDPWISTTDRGFWILVKKATWADDRLRQIERENA